MHMSEHLKVSLEDRNQGGVLEERTRYACDDQSVCRRWRRRLCLVDKLLDRKHVGLEGDSKITIFQRLWHRWYKRPGAAQRVERDRVRVEQGGWVLESGRAGRDRSGSGLHGHCHHGLQSTRIYFRWLHRKIKTKEKDPESCGHGIITNCTFSKFQ